MDLSIIIPLYNEEESLPELHDWIVRVVSAMSVSYEIIFVDDGSNDTSWKVVEELKAKNTEVVKGIKFRRNYGKSAALQVGFQKSNDGTMAGHIDNIGPIGLHLSSRIGAGNIIWMGDGFSCTKNIGHALDRRT
jgi:glycosyltransferase involved in cell wall biosynthesis